VQAPVGILVGGTPEGCEPEPKAVELKLLGSRPALAVPPVGFKIAALATIAANLETVAALFDWLGLWVVVVVGADDGDEEPEGEEAEGEGVEVVMHVL